MKHLFVVIAFAIPIMVNAQEELPLVGSYDLQFFPMDAISLKFEKGNGIFVLCEENMSDERIKAFRVEFSQPIEKDGLTIVANDKQFPLETGTEVFDHSFYSWYDYFGINANDVSASSLQDFNRIKLCLLYVGEETCDVCIKDVALISEDRSEFHPYYADCLAGISFQWTDVDGILHEKVNPGVVNKNVQITSSSDIKAVRFTSKQCILGGLQWASIKSSQETSHYSISFQNPVSDDNFEWVAVTNDGNFMLKSIDKGAMSSFLDSDVDIASCGIRYIGDTPGVLYVADVKLIDAQLIPTNISNVLSSNEKSPSHDVSGRIIKKPYKGICVIGGKKVQMK